MAEQINIIQITPFMHVPDLEAALAFFGVIGFRVLFRTTNYAYVDRDGAGVRVLQSRDEDGRPYPAHKGFAHYVDVRDIDALHRELKPKLDAAGIEFKGPANQSYNQRELMIRAPDGNVFVFGQAIEPA